MKHLILTFALSFATFIVNVDACTPFDHNDFPQTQVMTGIYRVDVRSEEPFWFATYVDNRYPFYSGSGNKLMYKSGSGDLVYPPNFVSTALLIIAVNQSDGYQCFLDALDSLGL